VATTAFRADPSNTTPIKHVVVIFQENVSFDHYFGTYPKAANPSDEGVPRQGGTPAVNGLSSALLDSNPNTFNPTRLDRIEPLTCDQDHDYTPEQQAFDHGLMDRFVQFTNTAS
jgi:phospholipase C